jgi:CRP-like cAMP-binding protein
MPLRDWPLFRSLSAPTVSALERLAVRRTFPKGGWLLEGGDRADWLFLLTRGLVREFYVTEAGLEHTRAFIDTGAITGSLLDVLSGEPAVTWIQALEATEALAWRYADFDALARRTPELETVARRHAEALAVRKTRREFEMLALAAPERLARWRQEQPGVDQRITRKLLASYLGITPVHLSRITRANAGTARRRR